MLSMALSLTVFLLPWGFCLYPKQQVLKAETNVVIPKDREILLMIEKKEEPLVFIHMRLGFKNLKLTPLSPLCQAEDDNESLPLKEIFKNGGLKYCQNALNRSFGFEISRFFTLDEKELKGLLKPFGSCDFTLERDISKCGMLLFKKGRCLINGENAALILSEADSLGQEERFSLFKDIVCALFNQNKTISEHEAEKLFNICANGRDNNLSVTDFISLKKYKIFNEDFLFS